MAITYEWSFPNFECDSSNVVKTIHWRYTATDEEHSASLYGSCAGSDTMNFDSMTKDNAVACVLENQEITEANMQTNLSAQIEELKSPALTSKSKDW